MRTVSRGKLTGSGERRKNLPVHVCGVGEQTDTQRVNRRVAPALVEEATGTIQVLEVGLVLVTTEEVQVTNLKVGPEVAGGVAISALGMLGTGLVVRNPLPHVVLTQIRRVRCQELASLGPEGLDGLRGIVQIDGETVGLVVVLHIAEDVIVDVAEELDLGLDAPVIAVLLEGRVLVEHAAVPAAHLVVRKLGGVLDVLLL